MSTSAIITVKTGGTYKSVYLHWDGDTAGDTLARHYTDEAKVRQLVSLGDLSSLGERAAPLGAHSFDDPEKGTTVAYCRDRGESCVAPLVTDTEDEIKDYFDFCGHFYLYDGCWHHNGRRIG